MSRAVEQITCQPHYGAIARQLTYEEVREQNIAHTLKVGNWNTINMFGGEDGDWTLEQNDKTGWVAFYHKTCDVFSFDNECIMCGCSTPGH
jgi:hypothetical protein